MDVHGNKTGGRRKGTPNKATAAVRALAQRHGADVIERLAQIAITSANEQAAIAAARELLDRGYGRPGQTAVSDGESPVRMEIVATNRGPASLYEFEVRTTDGKNVALASNGAKPSASSFALANQTRHFDNLTDDSVDKRQAFPWVSAT